MKRFPFLLTSGSALALSLAALAATAAPDSASSGANRTSAASTDSSSHGMAAMGASMMGSRQITIATDDAQKHTEKKFAGQELKGSDGKRLGKVHEFLVDGASGKVEYAVISSGGIGSLGDKMRLVPMTALQRSGKDDEFTVALDHSRWETIPPFADESLKADEVAIADSERRQIEGHFTRSGTRSNMSSDTSAHTAGMTGHLIKASDLRGKDVKAGTQEIGSIEGVVVDLQSGQAHALFDGKRSFLGSSQKYLVPLNRFTLAGKREPATTTLTRSDFESGSTASSSGTGSLPVASSTNKAAQSDADAKDTTPGYKNEQGGDVATTGPMSSSSKGTGADRDAKASRSSDRDSTASASTTSPSSSSSATTDRSKSDSSTGLASSSPPSRSTNAGGASQPGAKNSPSTDPTTSPDSALSPTGKTSSDQTPGSNNALITAAQAVRKALDEDETLSRAGVVITPEDGKLVLRGAVTAEQKNAIEEKAERAATGQEIDSKLTVSGK